MTAATDTGVKELSESLRHELKLWEKQFAAQHDGRKAGRDDIKADATISHKYKEYTRLRDILSGKAAPQTPSKPKKQAISQAVERTPKAQLATSASTPLKRKRDSDVMSNASNSETQYLSPQGPAMIGPTPQRDGIVLGLFDLLDAQTPSKQRAVLADIEQNVVQTPSRKLGEVDSELSIEFRARGEKTPQSSGKRFLLDKFVTPRKRKHGDEGTPTSELKGFSTPAFLRRNNALDIINEDGEKTPRPAPWKRRGLGRSLSSMIQSMKQQELDRLDEEAEIMRELEMEAEGMPPPKKVKAPEILVGDSQVMPLGPDGAGASEDDVDENEAEDGLDQNGKPRKVWKKRGQKRQTRRAIMRPNFSKPKPQPELRSADDSSEAEERVQETQVNRDDITGDLGLSDDEDGSDYASDDSHTPKKRQTRHSRAETAPETQANEKLAKEGPVKTAARKIKATAHANYRRLKIKSKGAKGGKGRFGRR